MRTDEYSREASLRRRRAQRSSSKRRGAAGLLALALAGAIAVGGTVAWLSAATGAVTNTFEPGKVTTEIVENVDSNVKEDVKVTNTGNIPAYIRAKVVVNWVDDQGVVSASAPIFGEDYTAEFNLNQGWTQGADGFYYYTSQVAPDASTGVLLISCKPVDGKAPAGCRLSVEILDEAIQALPDDAFNESWSKSSDLRASDGNLIKPSSAGE